jgi:hypothetical protein
MTTTTLHMTTLHMTKTAPLHMTATTTLARQNCSGLPLPSETAPDRFGRDYDACGTHASRHVYMAGAFAG